MIDNIDDLINTNTEDSLLEASKIFYSKDDYKSSLVYVNKALDKASKRYYEIISLKIDILIQLNMYIDALSILNEELNMPYIPSNYEEIFKEKYLSLSNLFKTNNIDNKLDKLDDHEIGRLLNTSKDYEVLVDIIKLIDSRNARNYLDDIKEYLVSNSSNFIKTMLLLILNKQEVNCELKVKKNNLEFDVNPIFLDKLEELDYYSNIIKEFNKINVSKNITIEQISYELLEKYIIDIYPLDINIDEYSYLAVALYIYSSKSLCIDININDYVQKYGLKIDILKGYINIIEKINNI